MSFYRLALPVALSLIASTSSFAAGFKDWDVGCDNTRTCKAVGMSSEDDGSSGYITVSRGGSADDRPQVSFWFDATNSETVLTDKDFTLTIDGVPVSGIAGALRFKGEPNDLFEARLPAEDIPALIQAFRNGNALKLTAKDGTVGAELSLDGSMASLLYMDDKQHRIGTVTALARPGSRAADTISAAPAVPEVAVVKANADAKANGAYLQTVWRKLKAHKDDSCVNVDGDEEHTTTPDGDVDALDATHTLVTINCAGAGAYNQDSEFFVVTDGNAAKARLVSFPAIAEDNSAKPPKPMTSLTNGAFDAKAGTIGYFAKGRGLGDCGDAGTYAWNGTTFVVTGASSMGQCKGVAPDNWPVYWTARTVAAK